MGAAFVPRFNDLVTMFEKSRGLYAARPLFGVKKNGSWTWLSYREFGEQVDHVRSGLAQLGTEAGDLVGVIAGNRLEWAVGAFASYTLGATYVPMYETQNEKDWEYILRDSGVKTCFVANDGIASKLQGMAIPTLRNIIVIDGDDKFESSYAALLRRGRSRMVESRKAQPGDVACIIYTSGTTGNPKGVRLTHLNLASNISGFQQVIPFTEDDRTLAFLPWAHVYGINVELNGLISLGASMAICESVDKIVDNLGEVRPTVLFAVPRIWNRIYDGVQKQMAAKPAIIRAIFRNGMSGLSKRRNGEPLGLAEMICVPLARRLIFSKITAKLGGRLKYACSGAAALSKDVGEFIDNLGVTVYEGYGMTETSAIATCNNPKGRKIGSVGKPLPGVTIKIDKEAPGSDADNGEVVIYGPGIMQGYHNHADETAKAITKDGGMRSGDLGRLDADGFLYITGRVKELYKLENGKYVAPAPLEEKITLSPFIAQVMIHGADRPFNVALIVPDLLTLQNWVSTQGLSPEPVEQMLRHPTVTKLFERELESYSKEFKSFERVKRFHLISEEFSTANDLLTPTLKMKRRNVLKRYEQELGSLWG